MGNLNISGIVKAWTNYFSANRFAWQWAETLVEIRGTLADIRNVDSIVGIPHKIYSMQRILIHIKSRSFC